MTISDFPSLLTGEVSSLVRSLQKGKKRKRKKLNWFSFIIYELLIIYFLVQYIFSFPLVKREPISTKKKVSLMSGSINQPHIYLTMNSGQHKDIYAVGLRLANLNMVYTFRLFWPSNWMTETFPPKLIDWLIHCYTETEQSNHIKRALMYKVLFWPDFGTKFKKITRWQLIRTARHACMQKQKSTSFKVYNWAGGGRES